MGIFDDIPLSGLPTTPLLPPITPTPSPVPFGGFAVPQPPAPVQPWTSAFPDGAAPSPVPQLPSMPEPAFTPMSAMPSQATTFSPSVFDDIPFVDSGLSGIMRNYLTSMNPAMPPEWTPSAGGVMPVPEVYEASPPLRGPAGSNADPFYNEPMADLLARRGQQVTQGAAEVFASVPEGMAVQSAQLNAARREDAGGVSEQNRQTIADLEAMLAAGGLSDQARQTAEFNLQSARDMQMLIDREANAEIVRAQDRPIYGLGETLRDIIAETVGSPDPRDTGFYSKLAQGAGSLSGIVASALAATAVGGPALGVATGGMLGAEGQTSAQYRDAVQSGADEQTALDAGSIGTLIGSTEILPIGRALHLLPSNVRAAMSNAFGSRLSNILAASGEEAAQEYATQVMQNVTAQQLYDPERGWTEGATENAILGAILGGGTGVIGNLTSPQEQPSTTSQPPRPAMESRFADGAAPLTPAQPAAPDALPPAQMSENPATPEPEVASASPEAPLPPPPTEAAPVGPEVSDPPVAQEAPPAPVEPSPDAAPQAERVANPERVTTVYTPDNEPVEVETMVVEADTLLTSDRDGYPMELQPRDRDRAASQAQIQTIAGRPVPQRLDQSPESDRGSPIVGPDGQIVESGNGRIMGLRLAYERGTADEYRAYVEANYPEAAGMTNPVIIRRRMSEVNERDFTTASNQSATLAMSATEQAQSDGRLIDGEVLSKYRGGDVGTATNRDMIRTFIGRLPQSAQGAMITKEGGLTIDGQRRFQSALFSRAYGDDRLLTRMAEATDDDTRSITQSLTAAAPRVAQLRQAIDAGEVNPRTVRVIDATVKAIQQIQDMRSMGQDLTGFRAQTDAFADPIAPIVDRAIEVFFNPQGTRIGPKKDMEDFLNQVVNLAMEERIDQGELAGVDSRQSRTPEEIVDEAVRRVRETPDDTGSLFDVGGTPDGASLSRRGPAKRERADGAGGSADVVADQGAGRREGIGRRPSGKLSPRFLDFSFNNRESVFQSALADAGIDADAARSMSTEDQIKKIIPMIEKRFGITVRMPKIKVTAKNRFGRTVTTAKASITTREALDQLLDAYQNMQMLAAVMGVPSSAIGLPIEGKGIVLSLVSVSQAKGNLGMFSWGNDERVITLPGRSNSFAHEWGHALDHFLNQSLDKPHLKGMLTRNMDGVGVTKPMSPKMFLTEAFADIMWSMFADSTNIAALTQALQVQAAQLVDGKPTDAARNAIRILNDMKEGKRPPAAYLSQYFKNAEAYDAMFGQDYFKDPAEMFARAFEAFVGRSVGAMSDLPQSFLSKGNWAYDTSSDDRLRLTFPKGTDADRFAVAMTKLSHVINNLSMFTGEKATAPLATAISTNNSLLQEINKAGLIGREKQALIKFWRNIRALEPKKIMADKKAENAFPVVWNMMVATQAHMMALLSERQRTPEAREALGNITKLVAKMRPGSGEFIGSLYQEEVETIAKRRIQKLQGALLRHFKGGVVTEADKAKVRALLIGRNPKDATAAQRGLAADMRSLLSEAWYDLKGAGIKVGYQDGYLPRIYDPVAVDRDRAGFRQKAKETYQVYFNTEVRQNTDEETQNADIKSIIAKLRNATMAIPDGTRDPAPRLSQADEDMIEVRQKARSALNQVLKDPNATPARVAKAQAAFDDAHTKVLDMLDNRWSDYSAENWETGIGVGQLDDVGSVGPASNFLEGRVLPPEADELMADFMQDDPIELIQGYFFASARRAEYAKRFGDDNALLNNMLEAARTGGATEQEIDVMKAAIRGATGRVPASVPGWSRASAVMMVWGALQTMSLSTFTSLAEPMVTAARTGRVRDGFAAIIEQIMLIPRKQRRQRLTELAKAVGMIAPYTMETVMENRMNADAMNMPKLAEKVMNRFFIINGLTPLTNFQRVAGIPIANAHILRALKDSVRGERTINSRLRDPISGGKGSFANDELNELGIAKEDRADLLAWLENLPDNLPRNDDLYKPDGNAHVAAQIWMRAINRLVSETIQNPLKTDRPLAANSPDLAAMYSIMTFITAFTRNVIFRNLGRGIDMETDSKGVRAAKVAGNTALAVLPFGALFMAHMVTTVLREALLNSDKLQADWEDDKEATIEWLMARAFSRTGITGRFDLLVQLATGIKYDRDLTSLTAGAYVGATLQNTQTIMEAFFGRNSDTTNTAEFNAAQALYRVAIQPAIALGLTLGTPGGTLTNIGAGVGLVKASSYDASTGFAEWLVGPKDGDNDTNYEKRGLDAPWWELG